MPTFKLFKSCKQEFNSMLLIQVLLFIILTSISSVVLSQDIYSQDTSKTLMNITVKDGDSLSKIATTYGITVGELMELNKLNSTSIKTGIPLVVPIVATDISPFSSLALNNQTRSIETTIGTAASIDSATEPQTTKYETITVVKGDTLSSLAIAYGSSVEAIQNQNQLSDYIIFSGQQLDIPIERSSSITTGNDRLPDAFGYITVLPNDTISALATTFCSSPELLMGQNNLLNPDIFIGQRLFVGQLDAVTAMTTTVSINQINDSTTQ